MYLLRRAQRKRKVRRVRAKASRGGKSLRGYLTTQRLSSSSTFFEHHNKRRDHLRPATNAFTTRALSGMSTHAVVEPHSDVAIQVCANLVLARLVHHIIIIKSQRIRIGDVGKRNSGVITLGREGRKRGGHVNGSVKRSNRIRATAASRLPIRHKWFSHRERFDTRVTTRLFCQYICMI